MKTLRCLFAAAALLLAFDTARSQPDTAKITKNALTFADSLIKTDSYQNWPAYANLAQPGVIKYYGGKEGFIQHIRMVRQRTLSTIEEDAPELKALQVLPVKDDEWQCVIRESRYFHKDGQAFHFITYFVGQSLDGGETWRLFDVSCNSVADIIYIFPGIFGDLTIKDAVILTPEQELAQQQAAPAATGKKAVAKKK